MPTSGQTDRARHPPLFAELPAASTGHGREPRSNRRFSRTNGRKRGRERSTQVGQPSLTGHTPATLHKGR